MKTTQGLGPGNALRKLMGQVGLAVSIVWALGGCGRLLDLPTPTVEDYAGPFPTDTARLIATRRATFTPVPATPSDTPTPTATPTPIIYTIKKGDTLLAVARQFGVTVQAIQEVNGIIDPRRLQIGQEIIIPPRERPEPTVVPTPTPVALMIQGLGFYRTPVDSLWFLGEVVNLSDQPAEEVQVQVSLHDEQGTLLTWGAAFVQLDILAPGMRAPFAILFPAPPSNFAQYQTRVLSGVRSTHLGPRYLDLTVVEDHGGWLDENTYQVRGQVQNIGQVDAERVAIVITLYDQEGHVVGLRTIDIPAERFLAGAVAPFEETIIPLGPVARYEVQIQGWWIGYQIPQTPGAPQATVVP
ncbi:MAG: FxLYD domain-containing protein [Anaerolineae bacterium]